MVQSVCRQRNGLRSSHRQESVGKVATLADRIRVTTPDLLEAYMKLPKAPSSGKGPAGKRICKQISKRLGVPQAEITGCILGRAWNMSK